MNCHMKSIVSVIIGSVVLLAGASASAANYPPLSQSGDTTLQRQLEGSVQKLGFANAVKSGALAVSLVDITDPMHPRYAGVNGNRMMYAASLPKIAILFGAFKRIEQGTLTMNADLHGQLVRMIRYSSNSAATAMMNLVGKKYIADLLRSPRYRLYDPQRNGGLWVGKEYGHAGVWKRDPLHHLSHGATAYEVARFYYLLETNRLVNPTLTRQMKTILGHSGINHKFVKGLTAHHPDSVIYRKSGSWRRWHADSALIERDGRRYIAVALAQSKQGGQWLQRLIVALDDIVFDSSRMALLQ
jgi:beta-lactamase class A